MLLVAVAISIAFTSCSDGSNQKYLIRDADGNSYTTDNYTFGDGCIKFKCEQCGKDVDITVCGSFTIVKLEK